MIQILLFNFFDIFYNSIQQFHGIFQKLLTELYATTGHGFHLFVLLRPLQLRQHDGFIVDDFVGCGFHRALYQTFESVC